MLLKKKPRRHKDYAHMAHNTCSSSAFKTKQIHYWLNKTVDLQYMYLRRGLHFKKFPTVSRYCVKNIASCM